jgi:integrase/recombinase XerD
LYARPEACAAVLLLQIQCRWCHFINHRLAAIKTLAKMIRFVYPQWSAAMDQILFIPQKRTQRQLIGFLYPEEIDKVLNAVDIHKAQGFRDYVIIQLLIESGARAS